jgi:hypothetical protein
LRIGGRSPAAGASSDLKNVEVASDQADPNERFEDAAEQVFDGGGLAKILLGVLHQFSLSQLLKPPIRRTAPSALCQRHADIHVLCSLRSGKG